jgi:tetratricopeptide (TPR) repeat protein
MRLWAFVLALAVGFVGGTTARAASNATPIVGTDQLAEAQGFFNAKRYREAITLLDAYLTKNSRDAHALVLRGDAKASIDDDTGALADYNAAIELAPTYQYAYETRCETRLELNDGDGAMADCNAAIRLDPADAKAYEDRADVHFDLESYQAALDDYDKAAELGWVSPYLFAARCDANRLTGHLDRAAEDCAKTLVLDPRGRRGLWANGRLAMSTGRYQDAILRWNAYILEDQTHSDAAYYYRASSFTRTGNAKAALQDIETYVHRKPNDADGYRERAFARAATGDTAGAVADLKEAGRLYERDGDARAVEGLRSFAAALQAGKPLPQLPAP